MLRLFVTLFLLVSANLANATAGQWLFESNRHMEAWLAGVEEHTLKVNDVEWHYYARHLDQADCTVLLHGFTAEASHWFRFARKLDAGRCLIIPDLPGFGQTTYDTAASYTIPLQVARLRDFLDAVKPAAKLNIVGSSMGGHISATYTLENPQRVASLTLFDAAGVETANKPPATITLETTGHPVFYVTEREAFYRLMDTSMSDGPWMPGLVLDYLADQFIARNDRHMQIFSQIFGKDKIDARLGEIGCPTLVVWGANDNLLDKSMADRYASLIKGAQEQMFEGVGHLPFLERPADSAELFEAFLQQGAVARAN